MNSLTVAEKATAAAQRRAQQKEKAIAGRQKEDTVLGRQKHAKPLVAAQELSQGRKGVVRQAENEQVRQPNALDRASAYARAVLDGDIIAGPHVRNTCRRHFSDLDVGRDRGIFFDLAKAQRIVDFFEKKLKLSEGQFEGLPFKLAPVQVFKLASIFGWYQAPLVGGKYDFDAPKGVVKGVNIAAGRYARRRFRRAYIEEGKGNGKSPFAGGIGLYGLCADGEGGAQIYAAAAKQAQANILFQDAVKMRAASKALKKRINGISGGPGKEYNMAHLASGSFFRPISKEAGKTGSGPRPLFALCDEVHEHPDRKIMEMLERGFKFRLSPLLLMITNSGSDRNSICWEEHEWACKVAAGTRTPDDDFTYVGEPIGDDTFSYVCAMDKDDNPLTDPSCWYKANPMLDIILSQEYLAGVVKTAKDIPGQRNGILRLHFCTWTDSDKGWMSREIIDRAMVDFDPYEIHKEGIIAAGVDLSKTRDLTAAAFVVETGKVTVDRTNSDGSIEEMELPTFDAWVEAWTPKDTILARSEADKQPYVLWSETMYPGTDQPYLRSTPGERIRYDHVASFFVKVNQEMRLKGIAYDRYAYDKFKEECENQGLDVKHIAHPQGGKIRARVDPKDVELAEKAGKPKPLGLWMPGSLKLFEDAIIDGRVRLRMSPVLMTALMGAALAKPDDQGNTWFVKGDTTVRIDPAVALVMAFGLIHDMPIDETEGKFQMMFL
jgi:phage terminase large subunit-like protein